MSFDTIDLNGITLDDVNFYEEDPKTIIYVRLMVWCNRFKFLESLRQFGPENMHIKMDKI